MTPSPSTYLPFAPTDMNDWTDFHYEIYYPAVELAVGARRELTQQEIEERNILSEVEEAIERGDANWADMLGEKFGTPDFEAMLQMDGAMDDITRQLDEQLEGGMMTEYD